MANRFERLFQLPENQYIEGSPVILAAGALLKDTETGSIISQLKFHSISENRIKAVKVSLAAYDISHIEVQGVSDYQYLELDVANGQEFGSNKAIVMPVPVTRSFALTSIVVVFADGTTWNTSAPFEALPIIKPLFSGNMEMLKQYRLATNDHAMYEPLKSKGIWYCTCGVWNKENTCVACHINQELVFAAFNEDVLFENMTMRLAAEFEQRRIAAEREAEEKRIAAEKEAAEKRRREAAKKERMEQINRFAAKAAPVVKIATAIVVPLAILILLFTQWILPDVIQPAIDYSNAEKMLSAGQYDAAAKAFNALGDNRMVLESLYQKACWLMNNGDLDAALSIFTNLDSYKNSTERVATIIENNKNAAYLEAQGFLENACYDEAFVAFDTLGNYKDSKQLASESRYRKALQLAEKGKLVEAITILNTLNGYAESTAICEMLNYRYAGELFSQGRYDDAKSTYQIIEHYENSADMVLECDYQIAAKLFDANNYDQALELYSQIVGYKDVDDMILSCKYQLATNYLLDEKYQDAVAIFQELGDHADSRKQLLEAKYLLARKYIKSGNTAGRYDDAISLLTELGNYKDATNYLNLISQTKILYYEGIHDSRYQYLRIWIDVDVDNVRLQVDAQKAESKYHLDFSSDKYKYVVDSTAHLMHWKYENGKYLLVGIGDNPPVDRSSYCELTVSSNWKTVSLQSVLYNGQIPGNPGEYRIDYTLVTDYEIIEIMNEFFN